MKVASLRGRPDFQRAGEGIWEEDQEGMEGPTWKQLPQEEMGSEERGGS